jgi:hypothetical protein
MNKKGFIFVETIIVTTVLTVALLTIYLAFINVLSNEKRRATFNDTSYVYRTYYIEDFLVSLNLNQYINKYLIDQDKKIVEFNCSDMSLYNSTKRDAYNNTILTDDEEIAKEKFCETIINSGKMNVKHLYITKYDISDLKKCLTTDGKVSCDDSSVEALNNVSSNFVYYLKTLSSSVEDAAYYRLIAEYEETDLDSTNTSVPSNNKCPSDYTFQDNKCLKNIKKNYYSNVKIVVKGDQNE